MQSRLCRNEFRIRGGRRDGVARYDHVLNCVSVRVGGAYVRILIRNQIRPHADIVGNFVATPTCGRTTVVFVMRSYSIRDFHSGCKRNIDRRNALERRIRLRNDIRYSIYPVAISVARVHV
jgi:hypothetical protein